MIVDLEEVVLDEKKIKQQIETRDRNPVTFACTCSCNCQNDKVFSTCAGQKGASC